MRVQDGLWMVAAAAAGAAVAAGLADRRRNRRRNLDRVGWMPWPLIQVAAMICAAVAAALAMRM